MDGDWLSRLVRHIVGPDAESTHLAIGAMLVMTILYATTMI